MKKRNFHFDVGNTAAGPLGFCAEVLATTPQEALKKLRMQLPDTVAVDTRDEKSDVVYMNVYTNCLRITVDDIDDVTDIEEGEKA